MQYLFGEYLVHHGKLNIHEPISINSGYLASVFIIAVVTVDGPDEVDSLSRINSSV